jgi:hypothetical protein
MRPRGMTAFGSVSPVATHPGEGRLTPATAAAQAWRPELVFMPLSRPSRPCQRMVGEHPTGHLPRYAARERWRASLSLVATNVQKSEDHARRRPNLGEDSDMSLDSSSSSSSLSRRSVGSVAASVVTDTAMVMVAAASSASPWIVLRSLALMGRLWPPPPAPLPSSKKALRITG